MSRKDRDRSELNKSRTPTKTRVIAPIRFVFTRSSLGVIGGQIRQNGVTLSLLGSQLYHSPCKRCDGGLNAHLSLICHFSLLCFSDYDSTVVKAPRMPNIRASLPLCTAPSEVSNSICLTSRRLPVQMRVAPHNSITVACQKGSRST